MGDVVLIHDDGPRMQWKLPVVENLHEGGDGLIHAADLRTSSGKTNRPIIRLYPLEVTADDREPVKDTVSYSVYVYHFCMWQSESEDDSYHSLNSYLCTIDKITVKKLSNKTHVNSHLTKYQAIILLEMDNIDIGKPTEWL